ncbi:hypothetical protein [Klebsiella michiganensis]|uniref:hypothetical protein n=1 Tax=Klebsiella michiganensis TaxID=1134687 RepID=UPI0022CDFC6E|nr:hypothetical protein [Klebsiella michiganensis]WBK50196.1 hypothetical protein OEE45_15305 [Klebsiella michiganensis]HBM3083340.1 hypothetical protein [Klebsiella michiganensis]
MINQKLTNEELDTLILKLTGGYEFYFQNVRRPGANNMAELLTKAAAAANELQDRRKHDEAYFNSLNREEITCELCGRTTTHPEGWHYCSDKAKE